MIYDLWQVIGNDENGDYIAAAVKNDGRIVPLCTESRDKLVNLRKDARRLQAQIDDKLILCHFRRILDDDEKLSAD